MLCIFKVFGFWGFERSEFKVEEKLFVVVIIFFQFKLYKVKFQFFGDSGIEFKDLVNLK